VEVTVCAQDSFPPERNQMSQQVQVVSRAVRYVTVDTDRPWVEFRAAYEAAVPHFDRLEAIGVVLSDSGWDAIARLSNATATNGLVNFFEFDPSPVMALNGNCGKVVTYLAGNIVKAEVGFRRDPACFLYVPLRVAIACGEDGNARLTFDHPCDLFDAFGDHVLDGVAKEFTETLAGVLELLAVPGADVIRADAE
jgi:uncharacterized protein (DUF302 family)